MTHRLPQHPPGFSIPLHRMLRTFVLAALACTACGLALADPPARVGRLAWLAGDVTLRETATAASTAAQLNWPVSSGNVLATGPAGRAEVWIGSSAVRLDVGTEVQVEQLDDDQLRLRLLHGSLALRSATPEVARATRVASDGGTWSPAEPGEFRLDATNGRATEVTAWRGAVVFEGDGGNSRFTVRPGQRGEITPSPAGIGFRLDVPVEDDFRNFVAQRDAAFDGRTAARHVSPEMTGIEDLDSHGRWQQTAEYGTVWVPTVSTDWAPYRYGRWRWVDPWGWTWIDDAPWGFAPFHYGRWAMWNGRWCWAPGTYVARPVYAPALVGWVGSAPPASSVSVSISVGSAPVGWFPLAPHEVYVPPYSASPVYMRNVNVTHVTNITNVTNIVAPTHYTFQNDVRATTVVNNGAALASRQPVAQHLLHPSDPRWHQVVAAAPVAAPPRDEFQRAEPHAPGAVRPQPPQRPPEMQAQPAPRELQPRPQARPPALETARREDHPERHDMPRTVDQHEMQQRALQQREMQQGEMQQRQAQQRDVQHQQQMRQHELELQREREERARHHER